MHVRNVVLTAADEPLLIDFGLAVESDGELCYDLYGDTSGVPMPEAHRKQGTHNGVWWRVFGHVGLVSFGICVRPVDETGTLNGRPPVSRLVLSFAPLERFEERAGQHEPNIVGAPVQRTRTNRLIRLDMHRLAIDGGAGCALAVTE